MANRVKDLAIPQIMRKLLRRKIQARRLLFCISSGRAGSAYLAGLLETTQEIHAEHEPAPRMTGVHLNSVNREPFSASYQQRSMKASAVRLKADSLPIGKTVYAETSHMFIKTFFDVVMAEFAAQIEVIVLRRNLDAILKSFIELGYFSERNDAWQAWMSSPNSRTSAIRALASDGELGIVDRCIAYLVDIEARVERFSASYPKTPMHHIELESLERQEGVELFFNDLNVTPSERTWQEFDRPVNKRKRKKQEIGVIASLAECHDRWQDYAERANSAGIVLPLRVVDHVASINARSPEATTEFSKVDV